MVNLQDSIANGTLIWYYYICKRQVWFASHGIKPNPEDELLSIGRLIHENYYRTERKEFFIDNKIKVDLMKGREIIGEVKKSSHYFKSSKMQLAFYLLYIEEVKGIKLKGILLIPEEKKKYSVRLTKKIKKDLYKAVRDIEMISKLPKPPKTKKIPFCRSCAYRELCWS